jgi:hypothetical protein
MFALSTSPSSARARNLQYTVSVLSAAISDFARAASPGAAAHRLKLTSLAIHCYRTPSGIPATFGGDFTRSASSLNPEIEDATRLATWNAPTAWRMRFSRGDAYINPSCAIATTRPGQTQSGAGRGLTPMIANRRRRQTNPTLETVARRLYTEGDDLQLFVQLYP